jgi:heat shock protein HspQ
MGRAFDVAWTLLKDESSRDNPTGNPSIQRLIDKVRGKDHEQPEVQIEHRPKTGNPAIDRLLDKVREQKDRDMRVVE